METLLRDLRYAVKVLMKRRMLTAAAVICLALGIGMTTVVFSLVSGILLNPLSFDQPDRIVVMWNHFLLRNVPRAPWSWQEIQDLKAQTKSFETIGGMLSWYFNITSGGEPERVVGGRSTASLFDVLGVQAAIGRTFNEEEEKNGANVVVLSHGLWQRRFGGDPAIIGQAVSLAEIPYTVVGVMPEHFSFVRENVQMWVPLVPNPAVPRAARGVLVGARLKPGVSHAQAEAELAALEPSFKEAFPKLYTDEAGWGMHLVPIHEQVVGKVRARLLVLFGAVGLVLLIACVNVANLLLAQATTREKEVALRAALGARRRTIIRQLLTESVLLAGLGGVLGLLLAYGGIRLVLGLELGDVPRTGEIGLDLWVLLFAAAISLGTGILFGLVPALKALQIDLYATLKEGGKTSAGASGRHPLRSALVVAEIALALVVLIGAGLMMRSFQKLQDIDPGFRTENVLTMQLVLQRESYPQSHQKIGFYRQLMERLAAHPEIRTAGMVSHLPLQTFDLRGTINYEGGRTDGSTETVGAGMRMISPDFFQAMGIPLLKGRTFTEQDHEEGAPVVILDAGLARRMWPDADPIGKRVQLTSDLYPTPTCADPPCPPPWRTVVGVVGQIKQRSLAIEIDEQLYVPYPQYPFAVLGLALHTVGEPTSALPTVRDVVRSINPLQPIANITPIDKLIHSAQSGARFNRILFGLFGGAALILAAIGVYGVMAYSVAQRRREMGLRLALGARAWDVILLVLRQGLILTLCGLVAGIVAAWLSTRLLSTFLEDLLFGVAATDLSTFVLVALLLGALALLACLLPARRATRVNPMAVLREE